ncbi:MAG: peptidase, M16 family [Candidatus Jettenia ecosi]|uniref:Peptidase, M16 family n=1 Tax=Candidatus Jettenia ecosi TaxID=2494326 RepID=A0A533QEG0_9BACT|nr:MAG: peptidase, M16 family [Candidatus Jettenia ecosi]
MVCIRKFCRLLKSVYFMKKMKRELKSCITILALFSVISCMCYGENIENKESDLFQGTQQASVFYLDNGMEVIFIENHANPMIASVTIVKTGSRNEDAASNGSAHFLEHLLFNGTKKRTQEQLYNEMDFYGGYNNAHTATDHTNYMILMPKEYIAQGMDIQADMLFNSTLPVEKFEKERGIVIEEIGKSANQPAYQVQNYFQRIFYTDTPYERPILGTASTISHLKRDQVLAYYQTWYVPNNMALMVIGDFTTAEMLKLVKEKYGLYPPGPLPGHESIQLKQPSHLRIVRAHGVGKFPDNQQYLTIAYLLPPPASVDFASLGFLTEFLGSKENSILEALFNQESYKDMVNTISANLDFNRDFSTLQISAELPLNTDVDRVVELIIQSVQSMANNSVLANEISSAMIARQTQEIYLLEQLHYYAMMKSNYLVAGGYPFLQDYMDTALQVTPLSIRKAAEHYLRDRIPMVTLMSPPLQIPDVTKAQSLNQYHRETLGNGLTVAVKENKDSRVIGIHLLAKERSLSEGKDAWGMTEILQRTLLEGGTDKHPGKALYQEFESIGAELKVHDNPYIPFDDYYHTPQFAYIRLKSIDTFFEKGLELLAEMVSQPKLTKEAFDQAKRQVIPLSATAAMNTGLVAHRLLYDNLFIKNPGFGWLLGDAKRLEKLQLQEVQAFHRTLYNPANLMLVISGNLPIEEVMKVVKNYFSNAWGEAGWQPPAFTPQFGKLGITIHEKTGKSQSYIALANTFEVKEEDKPAVNILGNLFSDRLAFNLREKQGLAYTVGIQLEKYRDAHWYIISMGTRPENIKRALTGIREEISNIRKATFEADEVQRTINAAIGRRGMRRLDRVNQAYYISMELLDGNTPEADDQYNERLKKVTPQDLERLVYKVFQNDNHLIVIVE